ncbi:MAG: transcription termination/antitermination protein NusA [Clostridia bacterium]|nr:transcription termination/antitermination protein NusA [Clostridia bacterium]
MNKEFFKALDLLERQKGIPKEYMKEKVEAALQAAFRKETGTTNVKVVLDDVKMDVKVYQQLAVIDIEEEERKAKEEYERREAEKAALAAELAAQEDEGEEVEEEEEDDGFVFNKELSKKPEEKKERYGFRFNPNLHITVEEAQKKSKRYKVGDTYEIEIKPKNFGRISAHAAKQVIVQAIKEAERGMMIKEYESKKEEIVTAVVSRINPINGDVTLEIGKNAVVLFKKEQIPGEELHEGDVVRVYVLEVKKETEGKGPAVVLSRTHAGFVKRLFELEVPEIQDGTVIISSVAREAGSRTKIAVYSRDENVDAIGSCIGAKGMRKNNITKELAGEKIDIVKYSEDPEEFIKAALAPAQVVSVTLAEDGSKACTVLVDEDQLSLAIGKKGQNARLVARLTGYKIDIKSAADMRRAALEDLATGKTEATTSFGAAFAQALASKMAVENNQEQDEEKTEEVEE